MLCMETFFKIFAYFVLLFDFISDHAIEERANVLLSTFCFTDLGATFLSDLL